MKAIICHYLFLFSHLQDPFYFHLRGQKSLWKQNSNTESLWLEGTSGGLWSSLLLQAGPAVRSDQVAQGFAQLGLESLHGWGPHSLPGQPVLLPGCPQSETISAYIPHERLSFQLMSIVSCSPTMHHDGKPSFIFSITSPQVPGVADRSPLCPLVSALVPLSLFPGPLTILMALHWNCSIWLSFLVPKGSKLVALVQIWSNKCQVKRKVTPFDLLPVFLLTPTAPGPLLPICSWTSQGPACFTARCSSFSEAGLCVFLCWTFWKLCSSIPPACPGLSKWQPIETLMTFAYLSPLPSWGPTWSTVSRFGVPSTIGMWGC